MKTILLCAALALAAFIQAASAGVVIALDPGTQTTIAGGNFDPTCGNGTLRCVIFSGTITPDELTDTFLNAISISFAPPTGLLASIDGFFYSTVPGLLLSTDAPYTGPIFALEVADGIAAGTYSGTLTLLGGAGETERNELASAPFEVVVTPEPATWVVLVGFAAIVLFRRGVGCASRRRTQVS